MFHSDPDFPFGSLLLCGAWAEALRAVWCPRSPRNDPKSVHMRVVHSTLCTHRYSTRTREMIAAITWREQGGTLAPTDAAAARQAFRSDLATAQGRLGQGHALPQEAISESIRTRARQLPFGVVWL